MYIHLLNFSFLSKNIWPSQNLPVLHLVLDLERNLESDIFILYLRKSWSRGERDLPEKKETIRAGISTVL